MEKTDLTNSQVMTDLLYAMIFYFVHLYQKSINLLTIRIEAALASVQESFVTITGVEVNPTGMISTKHFPTTGHNRANCSCRRQKKESYWCKDRQ